MTTIKRAFWVAVLFVSATTGEVKAGPPGVGWNLTFGDEFNSESTYDHTKWTPNYVDGSHTLSGNSEAEYYVDSSSNIDLSSGTTLKLTALLNYPVAGYSYSSGMLSSHNFFNQTFGYWECYAKVPSGAGVWPAFWTLEDNIQGPHSWPPEVDIMEYIGASTPSTAYLTNHWSSNYPMDGGNNEGLGSVYNSSQPLSNGFHKFAMDWEPDSITWYVDDVPRYTTTTNIPYVRAMHAILNLAIGGNGSWPGPTNGSTPIPSVFEVDYIHVYSRPLPSPWAAMDIGSPANPGRTYASKTGLMNVYGSGAGITGASDQFHYAYAPLNGNGTIIARVKNEVGSNSASTSANAGTLVGLMIRETLNANSTYALMALEPVIGGVAGGNVFSARTTTGGSAAQTTLGNGRGVPSWLKLVRNGTTFTAYSSSDGTTWTQNGTTTISMAASVYVGLAVTGSTAGNWATAQFDNISISGASSPVITSIVLDPPSAQIEPGSTQQFTATARDQYGNLLSPQPAFTWTVSGGGTINSSGLFTAGGTAGGPYTVTATNGSVNGSAHISVVNVPNAPSDLTATPTTMLPGQITLNWTNHSTIAAGYSIETYSYGSGLYIPLATVGPNVTTWTQTGLPMPSGPYTYRIFATGTGGLDSAYSNTVDVSLPNPPNGPTGLTVTQGINQAVISWSAIPGASNYNILRATSPGGPYSYIAFNISGTTYTDMTATNGTTYYYEVQWNGTYNGGIGTSLSSNPVSSLALASIAVTPSSSSVAANGTQSFTATGKDSLGNNVAPQPAFVWSVSGGGSINSSGQFTAGAIAGGPFTITAASGGVNRTAAITVTSSGGGGGSTILFDDAGENGCTVWGGASLTSSPTHTGSEAFGATSSGFAQVGLYTPVVVPVGQTTLQEYVYVAGPASNVASFIVQLGNNGGWASVAFSGSNPSLWTVDGAPGTTTLTPNTWHLIRLNLAAAFGGTLVPGTTNLSTVVTQFTGGSETVYMDDASLVGDSTILFDDAGENGCTVWGGASLTSSPTHTGSEAFGATSSGFAQVGLYTPVVVPVGQTTLQEYVYVAGPASNVASFIVQLGNNGGWASVAFSGSNPSLWTVDGAPGTTTLTPNTWHLIRLNLAAAFGGTLVPGTTNLSTVVTQFTGGSETVYMDDATLQQ